MVRVLEEEGVMSRSRSFEIAGRQVGLLALGLLVVLLLMLGVGT